MALNISTDNNYKRFKFLKGNRPLVSSKIKKLEEAVNNGLNLFKYCPIMINEDNYVIDGQHRLEACKRLKLPVYFVIVPGITLVQIAQLNATATKWKASDFFNCFIETGNKDYKILQEFVSKFNIPINLAAQLMMNGSVHSGGGDVSKTFTEGKFRVIHSEKAEKIMKSAMDFKPLLAEEKTLKSRNFIRAIQLLLASPEYKHTEVVSKLKSKGAKIQDKGNYKEFIFHIEELFNRGNSIRRIIYKSAKDTK